MHVWLLVWLDTRCNGVIGEIMPGMEFYLFGELTESGDPQPLNVLQVTDGDHLFEK